MKSNNQKAWRPRLSIELTEEQYSRLQSNIPWGVKQTLFSMLVDEVNTIIELHGPVALGAIFKGRLAITIRGDSDAT